MLVQVNGGLMITCGRHMYKIGIGREDENARVAANTVSFFSLSAASVHLREETTDKLSDRGTR
jgi:hypothetical protein